MKNDSAKNRLINGYVGQIMVAVKLKDPRLQSLIDTAMNNNVPKKVIDNALQKANSAGSSEGSTNIYEGMGPGGVAIVVETQTDNKNRTVALVRAQFTKSGHNLLAMGGCMHYFDKVGRILVAVPSGEDAGETPTISPDAVLDILLEIDGVRDFSENVADPEADSEADTDGPSYTVLTEPSLTNKVALAVQDKGLEVRDTAIGYEPNPDTAVELAEETRQSLHKLVQALEEIDEVSAVYTNESEAN